MRNRIYKTVTGHRGKIKGIQDQVKLGVYSRSCEVCGQTITRKLNNKGRFEDWQRFFKRKTCGMLPSGKKSECFKQWLHGENNPNYKGGLPICKTCGNRTGWYYGGKGNPQNYCRNCFQQIVAEKNRARMKLQRGIYPEALKTFAFKKGQKPHNFKYEFCEFKDCPNKHLSLGLCSKHYQQLKKANSGARMVSKNHCAGVPTVS